MVSTGSYIVNATVSSSGVSQITVGDQAVITPSGATTPVYGTVGSIGLVATTTSGVSAFPVVVNVTGSPTGLFGGTSANVSIIVKELQGVVVVPTGALTYTGGNTAVTLDDAGKKVTQPVTVGIAAAGQTQIVSGLTVGQQIYVTTVSFRSPLGTGRTGTGGFGGRRLRRRHRRLRWRHGAASAAEPAASEAALAVASADDRTTRRRVRPGLRWWLGAHRRHRPGVGGADRHPPAVRRAVIDVTDVWKTYRSGTLVGRRPPWGLVHHRSG